MNIRIPSAVLLLPLLGLVAACSDARDVKVKGDIAAATGVDADHAIRVEVYEPKKADSADAGTAAPELSLLDAFTLEAPGAFEQTVSASGDTLHLVALVDANGNEKCDAGEAWAATDLEIGADDTAEFAVKMTPRTACPVVPPAR